MIKHIKVEKLNGKLNYDLNFHSDLNIFTGRNGFGKTTLLKMLWYLMKGDFQDLLSEINFSLQHILRLFIPNIQIKKLC